MGGRTSRPSKDERREAILDVARQIFFEEGYAAASMSMIAARLGGSKGTLYNYFKNKEELFEAHVRSSCARIAAAVFDPLTDPKPVAQTLTEFGERFLAHVLSEWAVRTFRLVITEAGRSPELARIFYEAGPTVGIQRLQAYFEAARARGEVVMEDCRLAADQFMSLCRGDMHLLYLFNLKTSPTPEQIRTQVSSAVSIFMKAYGPKD